GEGAVGLVINRRSTTPISKALEGIKAAKGRTDPIYTGGPVGRTGLLALVRSHAKLEQTEHVLSDIYMVSSKTVLEKALASSTDCTAGKYCAINPQVSPSSELANTCPVLVPQYTPPEPAGPTDNASRRTVKYAPFDGRPRFSFCQLMPASRVRHTASSP